MRLLFCKKMSCYFIDMKYEEEERELIDQENEYIEQKSITDRESREKECEWEAELAERECRATKDSSHY